MAYLANSTRLASCSFRNVAWTWFSTVRWLTVNFAAICLAVKPFATWRSTSVSRSVRVGPDSGDPASGRCAMRRYSPSTRPPGPA